MITFVFSKRIQQDRYSHGWHFKTIPVQYLPTACFPTRAYHNLLVPGSAVDMAIYYKEYQGILANMFATSEIVYAIFL